MFSLNDDAASLAALEDYLEPYLGEFRRRDRLRWAAVYLKGLLAAEGRKSAGLLARHDSSAAETGVVDAVQALQNFVNQSPWDEDGVWFRYRAGMAATHRPENELLILDEIAILKQGRHSVGVQRQYSSALGRKANCQIALTLASAASTGVCPLALRLYLPRSWQQSPARMTAAGVPERHQRPQSRGSVALEMLEEVRAQGWRTPLLVVGPGVGSDRGLRAELMRQDIRYLAATADAAELGERDWIVAGIQRGVTNQRIAAADLEDSWTRAAAARAVQRSLFADLGLDHFEGRSWRGFHHHACLVTLAADFATSIRRPRQPQAAPNGDVMPEVHATYQVPRR